MRCVLFALTALVLSQPLLATYGQEDPRLEKLYGTFMSPCCWQQNLTVHDSPVANQLRDEIRRWVREGRTDEEIKSRLIDRYTARILAIPEGAKRRWLFVIPWAALCAGLVLLTWTILRMRLRDPSQVPVPSTMPTRLVLDDDWPEN